jgi:hypothetical protein
MKLYARGASNEDGRPGKKKRATVRIAGPNSRSRGRLRVLNLARLRRLGRKRNIAVRELEVE